MVNIIVYLVAALELILFTIVITYLMIKIDRSRPCSKCNLGKMIKRKMKKKGRRTTSDPKSAKRSKRGKT